MIERYYDKINQLEEFRQRRRDHLHRLSIDAVDSNDNEENEL